MHRSDSFLFIALCVRILVSFLRTLWTFVGQWSEWRQPVCKRKLEHGISKNLPGTKHNKHWVTGVCLQFMRAVAILSVFCHFSVPCFLHDLCGKIQDWTTKNYKCWKQHAKTFFSLRWNWISPELSKEHLATRGNNEVYAFCSLFAHTTSSQYSTFRYISSITSKLNQTR